MTRSSVNLASNLNVDHLAQQKGRTEKYYFFDQFGVVFSNGGRDLKSRVLRLKHLATEIWSWKTSIAKLILVISRLSDLKTKNEELNFAAK